MISSLKYQNYTTNFIHNFYYIHPMENIYFMGSNSNKVRFMINIMSSPGVGIYNIHVHYISQSWNVYFRRWCIVCAVIKNMNSISLKVRCVFTVILRSDSQYKEILTFKLWVFKSLRRCLYTMHYKTLKLLYKALNSKIIFLQYDVISPWKLS